MIPLALAVAVLFQQAPAPRPSPSAAARDSATERSKAAVTEVGLQVATMRTAHDAFRRAVFNFPKAVVVERAQDLQRSCQDLTRVARDASPRICRSCFETSAQRAFNAYRGGLPGVAQVGTRCTAQMGRILAAADPMAAARRDVYAVTGNVVEGLAPYEARVAGIRRALHIEATTPTPRR